MLIRKTQNYSEKKRTEILDPYINMLSFIVNDYLMSEFKGISGKTIEFTDNNLELASIFLDDDNIGILVTGLKETNFNIYDHLTGDLISTTRLSSFDDKINIFGSVITITPKKNILISYWINYEERQIERVVPPDFSDSSNDHRQKQEIYHCNKKGEILWSGRYNFVFQIIMALNDDTIFLRRSGNVILINKGHERAVNFSLGLGKGRNHGLFAYQNKRVGVIPYDNRGFICYSSNEAYLYDYNLKERLLFEIPNNGEITVLEIINSDTVIYGTANTEVVMYNIKEGREIFRTRLLNLPLRVRKIKLLPQNKCLVFMNSYQSINKNNRIMFINLYDEENPTEKAYSTDKYADYIGITSDEDVMFYIQSEESTIIKYNITKKEDTKYKIGANKHVTGLSSFDNIIVKDGILKSKTITIWE